MLSNQKTNVWLGGIAVVILLLASLACQSTASSAQEAPAESAVEAAPTEEMKQLPGEEASQLGVESVKLLRDDGNGNPGEEVPAFAPTDRKMHFEVTTKGFLKPGSKVTWIFTAVDTTAGQN